MNKNNENFLRSILGQIDSEEGIHVLHFKETCLRAIMKVYGDYIKGLSTTEIINKLNDFIGILQENDQVFKLIYAEIKENGKVGFDDTDSKKSKFIWVNQLTGAKIEKEVNLEEPKFYCENPYASHGKVAVEHGINGHVDKKSDKAFCFECLRRKFPHQYDNPNIGYSHTDTTDNEEPFKSSYFFPNDLHDYKEKWFRAVGNYFFDDGNDLLTEYGRNLYCYDLPRFKKTAQNLFNPINPGEDEILSKHGNSLYLRLSGDEMNNCLDPSYFTDTKAEPEPGSFFFVNTDDFESKPDFRDIYNKPESEPFFDITDKKPKEYYEKLAEEREERFFEKEREHWINKNIG